MWFITIEIVEYMLSAALFEFSAVPNKLYKDPVLIFLLSWIHFCLRMLLAGFLQVKRKQIIKHQVAGRTEVVRDIIIGRYVRKPFGGFHHSTRTQFISHKIVTSLSKLLINGMRSFRKYCFDWNIFFISIFGAGKGLVNITFFQQDTKCDTWLEILARLRSEPSWTQIQLHVKNLFISLQMWPQSLLQLCGYREGFKKFKLYPDSAVTQTCFIMSVVSYHTFGVWPKKNYFIT